MYTLKRPVNISCGKLPNNNVCIYTNAQTYSELQADMQANPLFASISGQLSDMSVQYNGQVLAIGRGEIPFLKYNKTESDLNSLLSDSNSRITKPNGVEDINPEFKYWPTVTLVEGGKVQTSGAVVNFDVEDTKTVLANKIIAANLAQDFESKNNKNVFGASKAELLDYALNANKEDFAKKSAPQAIPYEQLLVKYGELIAENQHLKAMLGSSAEPTHIGLGMSTKSEMPNMLAQMLANK